MEDDRQLWLPEPPKIYIGELRAPARYIVTTGFDDLIAERANQFFDEVLTYLKYNDRAIAAFTEREDHWLVKYLHDKIQPTEEQYIRLLIIRDILAASVISRRNDGNNCEVSSAYYLTPELVTRLQEGII